MFNWIYRLSDNQFLFGGPYDPVFNPATEGLITTTRHPDPRTERYDGAGGIRPATEQEITDYDIGQVAEQALSRFDNEKLVKALAIWTAGKLSVPLGQAKTEILEVYRALP
jgi:hypothetical protein